MTCEKKYMGDWLEKIRAAQYALWQWGIMPDTIIVGPKLLMLLQTNAALENNMPLEGNITGIYGMRVILSGLVSTFTLGLSAEHIAELRPRYPLPESQEEETEQ